MAQNKGIDIVEVPDYEEGGVFVVDIDDVRYSIPRHCPHRKGWLEHGIVNMSKKTITCPLHFSTFSLVDGRQISGPPCGRLNVISEK